MNIQCLPLKTRPILPPQDDIYAVLEQYLPTLHEKDVLCITSKILAIHQGRCIKIDQTINKDELIKAEAEYYIDRAFVPGQLAILTLKEHTLIPSSGIDESNSNGYYILWPKDSFALAQEIGIFLKEKYQLKELAVIITDSHTTALRWGVLGISTGFYGLEPLEDCRGAQDIFGRKLKITQKNVVDALSVLAVAVMGEGNEQTPLCLIRSADFVTFTDRTDYNHFFIPPETDIYKPLLDVFSHPGNVAKMI